MALPDISNLTTAELLELFQKVDVAYNAKAAQDAADNAVRRANIQSAITALETVLGPAGSGKNTNNIRGILAYTDTEMAANAGIAFRRAFQGLEQLAVTMLDVAHVLARS